MQTIKITPLTKTISALAAAVLSLLIIVAGASPAAAAPTSGDPLSTGCANGAQTIWDRHIDMVRVEVRYSPACGTNWVRVSSATNRAAEAGIWSANSGWKWSTSYGSAPAQFWTPMVYAPGSTCIKFQVRFSKIGVWGTHDTGILTLC